MIKRPTIQVDTVIIGGGVAALWTANQLKSQGHSVLILTDGPIGEGQSLAAQGVIHGGLKYAIGGKLTDSSEALAAMPERWLAAMRGEGSVDLSKANLLCDHQLMWSLPNVVSQVVGFFGSQAVRGRAGALKRSDHPAPFDTPAYKGRLFRVEEPVVDPVSIMSSLAEGVADEIYQVDWNENALINETQQQIDSIEIRAPDGESITLTATQYLLAAGAGNGTILNQLGISTPKMQLRPLHQLIIRGEQLPDFYSVCVGTGPKPPLVSTTHHDSTGRTVWYIGGDIAEQAGVARSEAEQISAGKALFESLLPWVDLSDTEWFTWRGDRAEPETGTGDRPPGAFLEQDSNVMIAWPTKLALAPNLADKVTASVEASQHSASAPLPLARPSLGKAPWDLP